MTYNQIQETTAFLKEKGMLSPEVGIVLGTGLGSLAGRVEVEVSIDYDKIPHFPIATVESHNGRLIYGNLKGKKVLMMEGRFHYYEGYSMKQITFPIRVMKLLGVKELILSNAAGAINLDYKKGEIMLVEDHINLQYENPLTGTNIDEMGVRFPDMSAPYNAKMNTTFLNLAKKLDITLNKGIYVSVPGPNLETRAEYRMLKIMGADAVGMSTVPEVIVANHVSLPCVVLSCLTDECDPEHLEPVAIEEIIRIAGIAEVKLVQLVEAYLLN